MKDKSGYKMVTYRMPKSLVAQINEVAEKTGRTRTYIVITAVSELIEKKNTIIAETVITNKEECKAVTYKIPPELVEKINGISKEIKIKKCEFVAQALIQYIKNIE